MGGLFQRSEYYDVVALGSEVLEDFLDAGLVLVGEVAFLQGLFSIFGKGLRVEGSVPVATGEGGVVGLLRQIVIEESRPDAFSCAPVGDDVLGLPGGESPFSLYGVAYAGDEAVGQHDI